MNNTGEWDVYQAVANQDYERLVKIYAKAGYDALSSYSPYRRRSLSRETKTDEYRAPSRSFHAMMTDSINTLKQMMDGSYNYEYNPCTCQDISQTTLLTNTTVGSKASSILRAHTQEEEEIESILQISASYLTNSRPHPSFIVHPKPKDETLVGQHPHTMDPIYDGSVANSTPVHGYAADANGGGFGTILHLACVLDSPFFLAILVSMHGDLSSRYSAFRRTCVHEAACVDSIHCLQLLIDLSEQILSRQDHKSTDENCWNIEDKRMKSKVFAMWPSETSFINTLQLVQNLSRQIKLGVISEMHAAKYLLHLIPLSHANQQTLVEVLGIDNLREPQRKTAVETNTRALRPWVDGHGNSVLHWCAFKNSTKCLSTLLKLGMNPNVKAEVSSWTPLHDASYSDSAQSVSMLIQAGAEVNTTAKSGATPLCLAAQENAENAIRTLLAAGADPTIRCCGNTQSLIHDHPIALPATRFSGYTCLHYSAHYDSHKAAKILLEHDAFHKCNLLEITDLNDKLPIHVAVQRGSSQVLRELLHAGARVQTVEVPSQVVQNRSTYKSPPSSPLLRSMIPSRPVSSSKPWNCVSQQSIDECKILINEVEGNWSPIRHSLFYPRDRESVVELLRVGKHLEQRGTGIFLEFWPLVLSYCGRGWFEPDSEEGTSTATSPSVANSQYTSNELNNFHL